MKEIVKHNIGRMLEGLAAWVAYYEKANPIYNKLYEKDVADTAAGILINNMASSGFDIIREYKYSEIISTTHNDTADLVIREKQSGSVLCVIEFKMGDSNGGYKTDVPKLQRIKSHSGNIDCLSVVLITKNHKCAKQGLFIDENNRFRAIRGTFSLTDNKITYYLKVRRVSKVFLSLKNIEDMVPKCMALCLELENHPTKKPKVIPNRKYKRQKESSAE